MDRLSQRPLPPLRVPAAVDRYPVAEVPMTRDGMTKRSAVVGMNEHRPVTIHQVRLTYRGVSVASDLQRAHALVQQSAAGGRVLWSMPRAGLLVVKSDSLSLPTEIGREIRTHEMPAPPTGAGVTLSLIAHPVRRHGSAETALTIQECARWLVEKLAGIVDVADVEVEDLGQRGGWRQNCRLVIRWVGFAASGVVADSAGLGVLMRDGVGRAKGYGCGLLLVASR